jgi:glycosyltransferase involved in cell wall biosynthesis
LQPTAKQVNFMSSAPSAVAPRTQPIGKPRLQGGRRIGETRQWDSDKPRITVVTVVFNCVGSIEPTILNIIGQSYSNIEYIVVDGGSTDGTLELIKKYEAHIDLWISEKDKGIYNAMNKGIDLSTGDWINFMNAGDHFHSSKTVEQVAPHLDNRYGVVAGAVRYIYDENNARIKHMRPKFTGFYLEVPHHQASFINNWLMKHHKYDESFRIRGDLNFMIALHADGQEISMIDEVICDVDTNGVSSGLSKVHVSEEIRAGKLVIKNYGVKCIAYHAAHVIPRLLLRKMLPKRVESKVRSLIKR